MPLALTDEQRQLAEVVAAFATDHDLLRSLARGSLEGATPPATDIVWKELAALGGLGLHLPEHLGGSDATLLETAIVVETLGRAITPAHLLPSLIASATLRGLGHEGFLHQLADGSVKAAVAPFAAVGVDAGHASGWLPGVTGALGATLLLFPSGDDLCVASLSEGGARVEPGTSIDHASATGDIVLDGAPVTVLEGGARVLRRTARILASAEAAGGARATLRQARDYALVREQFGRAIGSFQAVKHHLADMLVAAERATAAAWDAARIVGGAPAEADLAAATATLIALDAYRRNAETAIQILGGIGFTWEHDAHLFLRRAWALTSLAGSTEAAADEVAALTDAGSVRDWTVDLPAEADRFRSDCREFRSRFEAAATADRRRLLVDSGYLVPHWPTPWGREAGPVEQLVIEAELGGLEIPTLGIGGWILRTITQHGNTEQLERWVRPSLLGELVWCQLFSEPGAGSDAAAVQARGIRVEGGWRVTGQKVWTSDAQRSNRGLATVRTNPDVAKHRGITTMAIDLAAAGVTVRPLRELTGEAVFNEVFLDDVFVPDSDVIGEVDAGWTVARATLGNERVTIGASDSGAPAAETLLAGLTDTGLRREVSHAIAAEHVLHALNLRHVERAVLGAEPGAEGNVTKLLAAEHFQRVSTLALRLDPLGEQAARTYLYGRAMTIAGGTTEISKNVIAERILGLPRDPANR